MNTRNPDFFSFVDKVEPASYTPPEDFLEGALQPPAPQSIDPAVEQEALREALQKAGYKNMRQIEDLSTKLTGTGFLEHRDLKKSAQVLNTLKAPQRGTLPQQDPAVLPVRQAAEHPISYSSLVDDPAATETFQKQLGVEPTGQYDEATLQRVKELQRTAGLTGGAIDGKWGPNTAKAYLENLDRLNKAVPSGATSQNILEFSQNNAKVLRDSEAISDLQTHLGVPVTGAYDEATAAAVKDLQAMVGARPDGKWGPGTARAVSTYSQLDDNIKAKLKDPRYTLSALHSINGRPALKYNSDYARDDLGLTSWTLMDNEGGFYADAYVPSNSSGVTVGPGVDLKITDLENVRKAGGDALAEKLKPFIGKKGEQAKAILKDKPLHLEEEEIKALVDMRAQQKADILDRVYGEDWRSAPSPVKKLMMDITYHGLSSIEADKKKGYSHKGIVAALNSGRYRDAYKIINYLAEKGSQKGPYFSSRNRSRREVLADFMKENNIEIPTAQ